MAMAGVLDSSRVSPYRVNGSQVWKVSQPWLAAILANHTGGNIGQTGYSSCTTKAFALAPARIVQNRDPMSLL